MSFDNDLILKSFENLTQECHDGRGEPIRPIASRVESNKSEIPILMPVVEDENLRPLLLSWYYAGYYSGRHQLLQELKSKNK